MASASPDTVLNDHNPLFEIKPLAEDNRLHSQREKVHQPSQTAPQLKERERERESLKGHLLSGNIVEIKDHCSKT